MHFFSVKKPTVLLLLMVFALGASLPVFAQKAQASGDGAVSEAQAADEDAIYLDANAALPSAKQAKGPSSVWILFRVVLVLAIVCAAIYGVVWLLKKTTVVNAANDPYLKSVSSITLAPNKTVQVVTIGTKGYLIGVTDQAISLIAEVEDRELLDAMNLAQDKKTAAPQATFASVLSQFLPSAKPKASDRADGKEDIGAFSATDVIRRQRERLSGAERDGDNPSAGDSSRGSGGIE
jgi:flagellar protein FliO/FliZ